MARLWASAIFNDRVNKWRDVVQLGCQFSSLQAPCSQERRRRSQRIAARRPFLRAIDRSRLATLAPFQHVRFCLRYPSDCKSDATEIERIELSPETSALLERVNRGVNAEIAPVMKGETPEYRGGWTIAPSLGDCNDYAVTKRHELLLGHREALQSPREGAMVHPPRCSGVSAHFITEQCRR